MLRRRSWLRGKRAGSAHGGDDLEKGRSPVPHTCHSPGVSTVSSGNSRIKRSFYQRVRQSCSCSFGSPTFQAGARCQSNSRSRSTVMSAARKIDARVPGRTSSCRGTITVREPRRSLQWLPLVPITAKPSFSRACTTRAPETTGSRLGLTQRAGLRPGRRLAPAHQAQADPRNTAPVPRADWPAPRRSSGPGWRPQRRGSELRTSRRLG